MKDPKEHDQKQKRKVRWEAPWDYHWDMAVPYWAPFLP